MRKTVVLLILLFSPIFSVAADKNSIKDIDAVLIRDQITVGIHAPKNYFLDQSTASQFGLCAFYVKNKTTLHTSPAVLYARIADPKISGDKGVDILVKEVADSYKSQSKEFLLNKMPDYKSKLGNSFVIRNFMNGPKPNQFEAAGYLKLGGRVVMVIYSTQNQKDFKAEQAAFYDLLDRINPYSTSMTALSGNCLYPKN